MTETQTKKEKDTRWDAGSDEYLFYLRKEHSNVPVGAIMIKLNYFDNTNHWRISYCVAHETMDQFSYYKARMKAKGRLKSKEECWRTETEEYDYPEFLDFTKWLTANHPRVMRSLLRQQVDFTRAEMTFKRLAFKLEDSMVDRG